MTTLHQIVENAKEELLDWLRDNPDGDINDQISEIADSNVPVYNVDRLTLLQELLSLAYVDDPGLLPLNAGVFDILGVSIYEYIANKLYKYANELNDMICTCEWCREKYLNDVHHRNHFEKENNRDLADKYCSLTCYVEAENEN